MLEYKFYEHIKHIMSTITLQALASTLNEEELADIKDQFDAIDVDKNGSISLEEMRQVAFNLLAL